MLLLLFLWPVVRWWARAGLLAYALFMAFTLVYSAEHYVSDILLGWLYAAGVVAAVGWWRRRREARRPEPESEPVPEPAALAD
jgi:membrane-associated phospholipid phosphatase